MIRNFQNIGKDVLKRNGYYSTNLDSERRRIFLLQQALIPRSREKGIDRAIALNFDLDKREFSFELDKELSEQNRDYFFAFKVGETNDSKKFLATNDFKSSIRKTIEDSLKYLEKKRKKKGSGAWLNENISTQYDEFLKQLRDKFYREEILPRKKKEEKRFILDEGYLAADQGELFSRIKQEMEEKRKDKGKPLPLEDIFRVFMKKKFQEGENTELPSIFLVKFNGRHIMEMEEYRESYLNLVYYDLFERFFNEHVIDSKICHICREVKGITGKISLPMKFYGTTNELFFENLKNDNAYRSFALCRECLIEVLTGMRYVENHLRDRIFDMDCYLIPNLDDVPDGFEEKLKGAARIIQNRKTRYQEHIEHLQEIMRKSSRPGRGFSFNIMFYTKTDNDFDILKYISNLELKPLLHKMQKFDAFTDQYNLDRVGKTDKHDNILRLWDIRHHLFPSGFSHEKLDYKGIKLDVNSRDKNSVLFRKDLLNFLEDFLQENKIGYHDLIYKFTDIFRRRFNRDRVDILSPFKMVLFMTILNQIDILKEEKPMNKGHSISEVAKEEYRDFFIAHQKVYEENSFRQGLFLLGTVISKIVYAQKEKKATFMKKINLSGIPAHRLKNVIGEVKEYASIYSIYEDPGIWGNIMDRLQGIEDSGMKGDEIVFYILTGVSYADYLGMKYGLEKKLNQETKGEGV